MRYSKSLLVFGLSLVSSVPVLAQDKTPVASCEYSWETATDTKDKNPDVPSRMRQPTTKFSLQITEMQVTVTDTNDPSEDPSTRKLFSPLPGGYELFVGFNRNPMAKEDILINFCTPGGTCLHAGNIKGESKHARFRMENHSSLSVATYIPFNLRIDCKIED